MIRIPLPDSDQVLMLSPRWGELESFRQIVLLVLLGLVPLLLVVGLYRYEMRLVRARTALALLSLRLVVIAALWVLIALQPVLVWSSTEELPGRILIAVDRSASMDVPDPQRPMLDKIRLARALQLKTPDGLPTQDQLQGWIKLYQEHGSKADPPAIAGQAVHDQLCRQVDKLTRSDVARALLGSDGLGLVHALSRHHKVELVGFDKETWPATAENFADLFRTSPGAEFTDLGRPLDLARQHAEAGPGRLLGVVLLSDGQHTWGASPVKQATELAAHKVPLYPVALGGKSAPPDIALSEVKAPANVFHKVQADVEVRFQVSGLSPQEIQVELHQPGLPLEHVKKVAHDGADHFYTVRFQVPMDQAGIQTVEVKVRPTDATAKEITTANNHKTVVIRVVQDKAKVLLIEGDARWEYHYLANALLRDQTMTVSAVVFVQPRVGQIPEAELEKIGNPRLDLPPRKEEDPLAQYDCIILGDVSGEQLPRADRRRLERYVADRGGTLVLLAGKRHMPLGFVVPQGAEVDPLAKLLPIQEPRAVSPRSGFPVTLTAAGGATPFLQMDPEPEISAERWADLPRHYWGVLGQAKPGATSLAYVASKDLQASKGPKDHPERTQALIVQHQYGFGRVLYVGLDSTWRWRFKVGDLYHHRFWGQVIRWAASDKLLPAGNKDVRFGSRLPVYRHGQEVDLLARLDDQGSLLPPGTRATAHLVRLGPEGHQKAAAAVPLVPTPDQPRLLKGQIHDLPQGRYRIKLDIPLLKEKLASPKNKDGKEYRDVFTVLPSESGERFQLGANWPLLETLAAKTGGELLTPESADKLAELLTRRVQKRTVRDEQRLWQDMPLVWVVLGLTFALLTLEWIGRKFAGLP